MRAVEPRDARTSLSALRITALGRKGSQQVGLVNYDSLFVIAENFVSFQACHRHL